MLNALVLVTILALIAAEIVVVQFALAPAVEAGLVAVEAPIMMILNK